jgi:hypothetical protein
MSIRVQKTAQFEFPTTNFPIDIATVPLRDARERYLVRRFRLSPHFAALLAERAFHVDARR